MKSFIVAATLVASSMSFAAKVVQHDYMGALHEITLDNACVTADTVKSIKAVRTCATELKSRTVRDGDMTYTEWYCPKFTKATLEYPRAFTRTVCTDLRQVGHGEAGELRCFAYGEKADYLADVINVQVWEEHGEGSTWPGQTKKFRFPACK